MRAKDRRADPEKRRANARARYRKDPAKVIAAVRKWDAANPDKARAASKVRVARWQAANRGKAREKTRAWAARNKPVVAAYGRAYRMANPGVVGAQAAKRRASKHNATPKWLTAEDHDLMRFLYDEAIAFSKYTGVKFHVDHIVPLRGETVCGLHVPWNLQVIAASKNLLKNNKLLAA